MNAIENIQYYIDKTMMEDDEFYSSVVTYLNSDKSNRSAQIILWEMSHSAENSSFFVGLDFGDFKQALDNMKVMGAKNDR